MTVKELKEALEKMPEDATVGYWDGDFSILRPCPAGDVSFDPKHGMVVVR